MSKQCKFGYKPVVRMLVLQCCVVGAVCVERVLSNFRWQLFGYKLCLAKTVCTCSLCIQTW